MEDCSEKPNPKPSSNLANQNNNNKEKKDKKNGFEFCKVCKLNHNQGTRHKYFPNHKNSLSAFLSRFQNKINDIRFFLKNPTILRHEHADRNRFWCVFCDIDVDELDNSFACENAINHFAGAFHLKNLKHFLWQYGGKTDCLDAYRILDTDLTKWEKNCKSLETEAVANPGEGSCGVAYEASNNIHNSVNFEKINNHEQNTINPLKFSFSNVVMPLQYNTNKHQISNSIPEVAQIGSNVHEVNSSLLAGARSDTLWNWNDLTANSSSEQNLLYKNETCSGNAYLCNVGVCQVNLRGSISNGESSCHVDAGGNVHSGAPPPWLEAVDQTLLNNQAKAALNSSISSNKSHNSRKLNPKRVGAAWAEKRKMELEKEKRGEIVKSDCDANWLPNFGRVWQSGSRKESRKEFEIEKQKFLKVESHSEAEMPIKIQPYISKRMRKDSGK